MRLCSTDWGHLLPLMMVISAATCSKASPEDKPTNSEDARPVVEQVKEEKPTLKTLTPDEERVMVGRGTEPPFTGKYVSHHEDGTYRCKRCGAALFSSTAKFDSGTGWPSFDEALPGAVREIRDPDGERVEIVCAQCGAHLGHVFQGEGFTPKETRHCVNSVSLEFVPATQTE